MFNSEYGMWEAAILGTKSNTRRTGKAVELINKHPDQWRLLVMDGHKFKMRNTHNNTTALISPKYNPGDICYLQEDTMNTQGIISDDKQIFYKEKDEKGDDESIIFKPLIEQAILKGAHWKNKRYMNAADARFFIMITDVKLERLQDISNSDCIAEGLHNKTSLGNKIYLLYQEFKYYKDSNNKFTRDPKQSYESLFKIVNESEPWDKNHWCLSYHFRKLSAREVAFAKSPRETNNIQYK